MRQSPPDKIPSMRIQWPPGVFSTADLLMESSLTGGREGRLQVNLNYMVEGVSETADGVTVQARDLKTREVHTYRAKFAVLAAGTIESARLALRSGLQPNDAYRPGADRSPGAFLALQNPAESPSFTIRSRARRHFRSRASAPARCVHLTISCSRSMRI